MENTAGPSTFKEASKNPGNWFRSNLVKIVIGVLVIAVLVEVLFGTYTLFSPSSSKNFSLLPQSVNEMRSAQFSLVANKSSYKKGEIVEIDVRLFTGGYTTDSSDLVVKYDPAYLSASGEDFAVNGEIYSEYPAVQVDGQNGLIGISGITLPGQNSFSGTGSFAKLNFKALKDGQTAVTVDYQPASTADSNVVLSGSTQDILGAVVNADITISDSAPVEAASNVQSCESFTQGCQDNTGKSGRQVCTAGAITDGSCGYDPKLTISCEVCKI